MNASTKEFPTLSQRVGELDLANLLDHASISNPKTEISIVLLSVDPKFLPNIDRRYDNPVLSCKSFHDFLRRGHHKAACVLVTPGDRAECSSTHLEDLLSARTSKPFEVIVLDGNIDNDLTDLIHNAITRIQESLTVDSTVKYSTQMLVKERLNESDSRLSSTPEYQFTKELIQLKVLQQIKAEPENFLKAAIKKIKSN
jgi:hypothetical protein